MEKPINRWPHTDMGQGVLFFAQLMNELLSDKSWDSFRAYAMDANARFVEFAQIAADVKADIIPKPTIEPALEEIQWAIKSDPIAKSVLGIDVDLFCKKELDKQRSTTDLVHAVNFIKGRIVSRYKIECETFLSSNIGDRSKRVELRTVTKMYCSHLLNIGYNSRYIRHCVESVFFSKDWSRITKSTMWRFFSNFDLSKHKYRVFIGVDQSFARAIDNISGFTTYSSIASIPSSIVAQDATFFIDRPGWTFVELPTTELTDPWDARDYADWVLDSHKSILFLVPHGIKARISRSVFVSGVRGRKGRKIPQSISPIRRKTALRTSAVMGDLKKISNTMFSNGIEVKSRRRLLLALNTAALAAKTPDSENQLISLWSALEALLPEPDKGTVRILHFEKLLSCVIASKYIERMIKAVVLGLRDVYGANFDAITAKESFGANDVQRLAAIITLDGRQPLRDELQMLCADNPLALNRLAYLWKMLSDAKSVNNVVGSHHKRVSWQIHRIYRQRNALVHAGKRAPYIDTLVVNLDDYFRSVVTTILWHVEKQTNPQLIGQVIYDVATEFRLYMADLEAKRDKGVKVDEKNILSILRI